METIKTKSRKPIIYLLLKFFLLRLQLKALIAAARNGIEDEN